MDGWIKLNRMILEWGWYTDPHTFRLFVHLLLKATHKPVKWRNIELLPGQLIAGRKVLAKELKLSEREIRTAITKLKSTDEIAIKATNKFSIVTVCNWLTYQDSKSTERPANRPAERPTSDQQSTTYKNVKKEKNNISVIFEAFRNEFPGTVRGVETELKNFLSKNDPEVVHLLLPALLKEKHHRLQCGQQKEFVPPWKNLSTWISKKCWEEEFKPTVINNSQSRETPESWKR